MNTENIYRSRTLNQISEGDVGLTLRGWKTSATTAVFPLLI